MGEELRSAFTLGVLLATSLAALSISLAYGGDTVSASTSSSSLSPSLPAGFPTCCLLAAPFSLPLSFLLVCVWFFFSLFLPPA